MNAMIDSIQVGLPKTEGDANATDPMQKEWTSAIVKTEVSGPVEVTETKLVGDGQANLKVHGGVDKAILSYSAIHYSYWQDQLGRELPHGAFGENLTISTWSEDDVCIGDHWQIGDVLLEVSQPRQPCWKLSRRWQNKLLTKLVAQTGFAGWYHRVLQTGMISPGDTVTCVERPYPEWTIRRANDLMFGRQVDRVAMHELMQLDVLAESWKKSVS